MAEGWANSGDKTCAKCNKIRSEVPKHHRDLMFPLDCETCYVNTGQPTWDNEAIIDLYNELPLVYNGMSSLRIITASDVEFVFNLFEVDKGLWDDYYQRIIFLNNKISELVIKRDEDKRKKEELKSKKKAGSLGPKR